MPRRIRLFWMLFALATTVYAAMVLWTLPRIAADAGGLRPFDLRPMGYSADEARAFLAALGDTGRDIYLGVQAGLDLAFPALMAATAALAFSLLVPVRLGLLRPALIAFPLVAMAFDWLENWRVRGMLIADDAVTDGMIEAASRATVMKSAAYTLEYAALLAALAIVAWGRFRRGRR